MAEAQPPPLQQKVKASGFMWKRGHRVKNWKRRWFVLRDAYLAYFEAPTKTNQAPKGVLPVGGCEISENAFSQTGHSHSFVLTTSIGVYMFHCDTQAEAADWLTKLKQSKTLFAGLEKFQKIWFEQFRKGLRKSRQSFKRAGFETNLPARVFGVPLSVLVAREGRSRGGVPVWVGRLIEYLDSRALRLQGLFRVSGHGDEIAAIRLLIESGEEFHLEARCKDPHSIAALLKLFIRELPEPLVPYNLYDSFLEVSAQPDAASRVALLRRLIAQLPWEHRALLQRLLHLLVRVNDHSSENSMGVQNLCICWAPNVFRADDGKRADIMQGIRDAPLILGAFKELIEHYAELFPTPLGGAGSSGGGSSGGTSSPQAVSPVSQSHPVSPLALFADSGALPEAQGSASSSAAESARRRRENRNVKMHIAAGEEGPLAHPPRNVSPPARVASPTLQEPIPAGLPPLRLPPIDVRAADLPPPPAIPVSPPLPPAPSSPRSLLRIDAANLPPPPPEPSEESQPEASMSRALLGKMMESFTPRDLELEKEINATAAHLPPVPVLVAPRPVSPLSFLPKIVPPSSAASSSSSSASSIASVPPLITLPSSPPPVASVSSPPGGGNWTPVKATRTGTHPTPLAHSLRRKDEMREMALLAEASRFIENAGPRAPAALAQPNADRLLAEVDAFLSKVGTNSPRKKESPRKAEP